MTDLTQRLRAATEGVTPGPWIAESGEVTDKNGIMIADVFGDKDGKTTAFIAAARMLIPEAAAALDAKDAEIARLLAGIAPPLKWEAVERDNDIFQYTQTGAKTPFGYICGVM